jgi:hypothetical protein
MPKATIRTDFAMSNSAVFQESIFSSAERDSTTMYLIFAKSRRRVTARSTEDFPLLRRPKMPEYLPSVQRWTIKSAIFPRSPNSN